MTDSPRLQRLSEPDLDVLIAELKQGGISDLTLFGRGVHFQCNPYKWMAGELIEPFVAYQLQEEVPDLAQRLSILTQLTSLNLCYAQIDDEGVASLAALTQLASLNLR